MRLTDKWEKAVTAFTIYKDAEGHCDMPASYKTADGFWLGKWLRKQRAAYKEGRLSDERISRLEALGVDLFRPSVEWEGSVKWERNFAAFTIYKDAEGHCNVPRAYKTADGFWLGKWLGKQRAAYKAGRLSDERISRLEALGFVWSRPSLT